MTNTNSFRNRQQLAQVVKDQQLLRAFEDLFDTEGLESGDIIFRAATTRDGAYRCDGSTVARNTNQDLFNAIVPVSPVTLTIASPGVVTWAAHGLPANTSIYFTTNGTLPTGIVAGTEYFVKTPITNSFNISATAGGAAINFTGSQSGVQTVTAYPYGRGDGSTTFGLPTVADQGGTHAFIIA